MRTYKNGKSVRLEISVAKKLNVSFHRYPKGDCRYAWLKACNVRKLISNAFLYSAHFKEDFETSSWRDLQRKLFKKPEFRLDLLLSLQCFVSLVRQYLIVILKLFHKFQNSNMYKQWKKTCGDYDYDMKRYF